MPSILPLCLCSALALCGVAHAATFSPTRFDDPPPDGCLPTDCSLREAVLAANAAPGADRIALQAGDYALTRSAEPPDDAPGTSQQLVVSGDLAVEGISMAQTRILPAPLIEIGRIAIS